MPILPTFGPVWPEFPFILQFQNATIKQIIFFQFCESLGWKGKRGRFDVLPLVLSSFDGKPHYFELPDDIVMRVKIKHPTLPGVNIFPENWNYSEALKIV